MHQKGINHTLVIENAQIFWQQGDILRELHMQRGISTNMITPYGLDGSGIESPWGRDFPHPSRAGLGSNQPPVQWIPVHFPG